MTTVRTRITRDGPGGITVRVPGTLEWTPTRRRNNDDGVIVPAGFTVDLPTSGPDLEIPVPPTGPGWCWRVVERVRAGAVRYVAVPDTTETIAYTDLIDVWPDTLAPSEGPEPAWWAALYGLQLGVDAIPHPDIDGALLLTYPGFRLVPGEDHAVLIPVRSDT